MLLRGPKDESYREVRRSLTPAKAWDEGTNIRKALRLQPQETWLWVNLEITKVVKDLSAGNSMYDSEMLADATDAVLEEFPALKLEEIALVCDYIRRGKLLPKLYGNFRTRELLEAFRLYEGQRAEHLEALHNKHKQGGSPRYSNTIKQKPWEPIRGSKEDLQAIGVWPKDTE